MDDTKWDFTDQDFDIPSWVPETDIYDSVRNKIERMQIVKKLSEYFRQQFGQDFRGISLGNNPTKLNMAIYLYRKYHRAIKHKDAEMWSRIARNMPVDKILDNLVELIKLRAEQEIQIEKELALIEYSKAPNSAFVFFQTRHSATIAAQVVHNARERWEVDVAPSPGDVFWENLSLTKVQALVRGIRATALAVLLVIFFFFPISWIQYQLEPEQIEDSIFSFLLDVRIINRLLESTVPQLIVMLFLILGHFASKWIASLSGFYSYSQRDRRALITYFNVIFFNVFLIRLIAGENKLANSLLHWFRNPSDLDNDLGRELVKEATYFSTFVLLRLCISLPIELIHHGFVIKYPVKLGWKRLKRGIIIKDKERLNAAAPEALPYHRVIPQVMLVLLIGVVFAPIAPIVVPFCAAYFLAAYLVWKHNVIYTYRQTYRSSGIIWPIIFRLVVVCFLVSQFTTFGVFASREAFGAGFGVLIMSLVVILFAIYCEQEFVKPTQFVPLEATRPLDQNAEAAPNVLRKDEVVVGSGHTVRKIRMQELYMPQNLQQETLQSLSFLPSGIRIKRE